ncbi:MAG TPA: aldo/keto reductase [Planctomycetota bacterium]|nr:aldo/keto reductase [Planctomycetota bacterium]
MSERYKWGILGTGKIAHTYARGVKASLTGELLAVGSRSQETADAFGAEFGMERRYASYEALLADKDVQCVYISMPHPYHVEWSIRALAAGKHVLCEKPMALNQYEAAAVFDAARRYDRFFMEAFMYRVHPQTMQLAQLVREKAAGETRLIQATFSFTMPFNPAGRHLANELGGGGILDVGCYPASMANLLAGAALGKDFCEPISLKAVGHLGQTGVDEYTSAVAKYPGEIVAQIGTGVQLEQENVVRIFGTDGQIFVPAPWLPSKEGGSTRIYVRRRHELEREIVVENKMHLYALEVDAVGNNIERRECPQVTWADSMAIMRTLDKWREEIGLVYEIERPGRVPIAHGGPLSVRADARMRYGEVAGVDKKISRVILGMDNQKTMPHLAAVCDDFIERGGTAFDTAHQYAHGLMEKLMGQYMKNRGVREKIVLIGKGAHTPDCFPDRVGKQLAESLERLQTDAVDIYFLHRDNPSVPVGEFVEALNEQHRAGRIRCVFGGSNWTLARVDEANAYAKAHGLRGFGAVSNNFSLARPNEPVWAGCISSSDDESRAWFERTRLPLFAWSSQARGFFTREGNRTDGTHRTNGEEIARVWASAANWQRKQRAEELAAKRCVAAINIALAYVLCQRFPVFALIGPRSIDETREAMEGVNLELTADEMKWLNLE